MGNLADFIEQYLRNILIQQSRIELQRRELAKMFRCAPSQINYVLETRFTLERGYIVESKRGGGGFIRITQIPWQSEPNFLQVIENLIPDRVIEGNMESLVSGLARKNLLTIDEAQLCLELMDKYFKDLPPESAAYMRSKFVKALLLVLGLRTKE